MGGFNTQPRKSIPEVYHCTLFLAPRFPIFQAGNAAQTVTPMQDSAGKKRIANRNRDSSNVPIPLHHRADALKITYLTPDQAEKVIVYKCMDTLR